MTSKKKPTGSTTEKAKNQNIDSGPPPGANIFSRICWVRGRVRKLEKSAQVRGAGGTYMAITHDDVTEAVRSLMARAGVFHILKNLEISTEQTGMKTSGGSAIFTLKGRASIFYINAEDPTDLIEQPIEEWVNDFSDKAPAKWQSYAIKLGLSKMFMLNTGEEVEQSTYDESKTYLAVIGEDEEQTLKVTDLASKLFNERAEEVLKSLAIRRFHISDGDWRLIPSTRMKDALRSLQDKFDDEQEVIRDASVDD